MTGAVSRGQFTKRTGSSIATGITAGATALLFEWIVYQLGRTNIDSIQLKNLMILGTERKRHGSVSKTDRGDMAA